MTTPVTVDTLASVVDRRRWLAVSAAACAACIGLPAVRGATAASLPRSRPGVLLAELDDGKLDPARFLVSEKYDGVRALWDGKTLRHRSGRPVAAPRAWLARLPASPLDGELWLGRQRFDALSSIVRRAEPDQAAWRDVRFMVFELPGESGRFDERARRIPGVVAEAAHPALVAVPQQRVADRTLLMARLEAIVAAGGEGLMLHLASAPVESGRSGVLRKLKAHLDAEATVVGIRPGAGKYAGAAGALEVEDDEGRRFLVGSGLSDALRREPPAPGSRITYRYRDRTPTGLPRFATYLRPHEAW